MLVIINMLVIVTIMMITNIFKIKNETLYTRPFRKYRVTEGCTETLQGRKTSAWGKWRIQQQNISGVWKDKILYVYK